MNRIDSTFARLRATNQKAFISYITAGDPSFDLSLQLLRGLADAGADILEIGFPFSDPLADGIVNQLAADRALRAKMSTPRALELIREFRKTHETPIVIFTYLNPIYSYGFREFHQDAAEAGADGILLLDLPPDEADKNIELSHALGLHQIRLIAPTTPDARVEILAHSAQGFVYCLSRSGVTGGHVAPSSNIASQVQRIQSYTKTPVCVGFGISNAEQAREVAKQADGVIVGSAIVKQIEIHQHDADLVEKVLAFTRPLIAETHA